MHRKNFIIGGGLVGPLLGLYINRKGYKVEIFERRPDVRKTIIDGGRSINLVVTEKGINALRELNLWEDVQEITVPVKGRMVHSIDGQQNYMPYSKNNKEANYSVSRLELNKLLIEKSEKEGVKYHFNHTLKDVDFEKSIATFSQNKKTITADYSRIFGTDGSGSVLRKKLIPFLKSKAIKTNEKLIPLGASYKELFMPSLSSGKYPLDKNALHIWPRGNFMLMALPNLDGSFTLTLYLPEEGENSFEKLVTKEDVNTFFNKYFKNTIELIPNLERDFFENPVGKLATVKCSPWHFQDRALLIGDAAHGIVPFFGQGMNAGFDDCVLLSNLMDSNSSWENIFSDFDSIQKINGDAIADMAVENYTEMAEKTADEHFIFKKQIEGRLGREFPDIYLSRYSMVTHTTIPYSIAKEVGVIQDEILEELSRGIKSEEEVNLTLAKDLISKKLVPLYEAKNIKLEY